MKNIFEQKAVAAEALSEVYRNVECMINDTKMTWGVVRELDEQDTHWKTGELLWEDEEQTIPKMKKEYGNVPKEFLSEDDDIRIATLERVLKLLEKAM